MVTPLTVLYTSDHKVMQHSILIFHNRAPPVGTLHIYTTRELNVVPRGHFTLLLIQLTSPLN